MKTSGLSCASFDGRSVTYGFGELDMLVPAYAATIHKSQGSEYPAVIIPVMTEHYAMLQQASAGNASAFTAPSRISCMQTGLCRMRTESLAGPSPRTGKRISDVRDEGPQSASGRSSFPAETANGPLHPPQTGKNRGCSAETGNSELAQSNRQPDSNMLLPASSGSGAPGTRHRRWPQKGLAFGCELSGGVVFPATRSLPAFLTVGTGVFP